MIETCKKDMSMEEETAVLKTQLAMFYRLENREAETRTRRTAGCLVALLPRAGSHATLPPSNRKSEAGNCVTCILKFNYFTIDESVASRHAPTLFDLGFTSFSLSLATMTDQEDRDILRGAELSRTCDAILANLSDVGEAVDLDIKVIHARLQALGVLLRSTQHLESCGWFQIVLQECVNVLNQLHEEVKTRPVGCASMIGQISSLSDVQNTLSLALSLNIRYL